MTIIKEVHLRYKDYNSDKEYHLVLQRKGLRYSVIAKFGPSDGTLTHVDKTKGYTSFAAADKLFTKTEQEKRNKGYKDIETHTKKLAKLMEKDLSMRIYVHSGGWEVIAKWVEEYVEEQV